MVRKSAECRYCNTPTISHRQPFSLCARPFFGRPETRWVSLLRGKSAGPVTASTSTGEDQRGIAMFTFQGALIVESGDVISSAVIDGQFAFSSGGVWAAFVESGGTLVSPDVVNMGEVVVEPGATVIGTVLSGAMVVAGTANDTLDYGSMAAGLGGVVTDTTVFGELEISSGGIASNTTVSSGGDILLDLGGAMFVVSSGGVAVNTTVSGGTLALAGGVASGTTFITSGAEVVLSGGIAGDTTVGAGGTEEILTGGAAGTITVLSGGTLALMGSPITDGFTIASGGTLVIGTDWGGGSGGTSPAYTLSDYTVSAGVTLDVGPSSLVLFGRLDNYAIDPGPASAVGVTVSSGGDVNVNFGGTIAGMTIDSGGDVTVSGSGTAIGTTVGSGGTLVVNGGVTNSSMISGGEELVYGGYAVNTSVVSGGALVLSGTEARGTTVGAGGEEIVSGFYWGGGGNRTLGGGLTVGTTVLSGGLDVVEGVASGALISGGEMVVSSGGMVFGTTVGSGGTLIVLSGATDGGFVFTDVAFSGGVPYVPNGLAGITGYTTVSGGTEILMGTATSDTVEAGGTLVVSGSSGFGNTGFATSNTVGSGGTVVITGSGGFAWFDRVGSGGTEVVSSGGMSESAIISSGGELVVSSGGTEWGAIVNGGVEVVASGGSASNDTINSGGHEVIQSGGAAQVQLFSGTVEVAGGGAQDVVTFMSGGAGTLVLDASTSFNGQVGVSGFGPGDQIDLKDIGFGTTKKSQLSFTNNGLSGTLNVTDGVHTARIQLLGQYIASEFATASDGHGGTLVIFTSATSTNGGHGHGATLATPFTS